MTARDDLRRLHQDIVELLDDIEAAERAAAPMIDVVAPGHRPSAMNLVHYWELRQLDLRAIQGRLAELGLSSLGRSEAHVRATLSRVAVALEALQGNSSRPDGNAAVDFGDGARLLAENANALLGPPPGDRWARIMVTLPPEAATDPGLVARLIDSGMAVARINCAHDDPAAWRAMAGHVRRAAGDAGRDCLIAMDLAGPKLRTGPLRPGPKVLRLRPTRNDLGRTTVPARAWLTSTISPAEPTMPGLVSVPVPGAWLRELRAGDVIELRDTRDSRRWLEVERCDTGGVIVGCPALRRAVGPARSAQALAQRGADLARRDHRGLVVDADTVVAVGREQAQRQHAGDLDLGAGGHAARFPAGQHVVHGDGVAFPTAAPDEPGTVRSGAYPGCGGTEVRASGSAAKRAIPRAFRTAGGVRLGRRTFGGDGFAVGSLEPG